MKVFKLVNLLVGLALIVLLLIAGFYLQELIEQQTAQDQKTILLATDSDCDLNTQTCIASLAGKTVELRFKQKVRYLTKFELEVVASGFAAGEVQKYSSTLICRTCRWV